MNKTEFELSNVFSAPFFPLSNHLWIYENAEPIRSEDQIVLISINRFQGI